MPTFGSLFSGIGGLDLGLERAGWECRWQVEVDDWCRRVLAKHWPNVPRYGDIREVEAGDMDYSDSAGRSQRSSSATTEQDSQWSQDGVSITTGSLEPVDLICGGFPCQPVSVAGKRLGELDERWLWPEFARVLRLLRPRYALIENVPGLFHRGFDTVLRELHEAGFDAEWFCLRASDVGAPHRRERVFIVAHSDSGRCGGQQEALQGQREGRRWLSVSGEVLADAERERGRSGNSGRQDAADVGQPPGDTRGGQWDAEPNVGRVANGVPSRVDRLRGLGNSVVPQVAEYIGKQLLESMRGGEQKASP